MLTYYDRLDTEEQRRAYTALKTALEQKSATAYANCGEYAYLVYEAVVADNPLLCISHPWQECVYDGRGFSLEYINVREDVFFSRLDSLIRQIENGYAKCSEKSDYALYKAIFDALAERISYDADTQRDYIKLMASQKSEAEKLDDVKRFLRSHGKAFSPYGALVEKKAVCNGISKLYKTVCDRFGLPCACVQARYVPADSRNAPTEIYDTTPCDHLLNVVEIDGQQAFVDPTNGLVTDELPLAVYDLFAVNYSVLKKTYLLRPRDLSLFDCNGPDNMYFIKNKLVFSTVGEVRRYVRNYVFKFRKGEVRIQYRGNKASDDELSRMVEDILSSHCPPSKDISGIRCLNGFLSCAIVDR